MTIRTRLVESPWWFALSRGWWLPAPGRCGDMLRFAAGHAAIDALVFGPQELVHRAACAAGQSGDGRPDRGAAAGIVQNTTSDGRRPSCVGPDDHRGCEGRDRGAGTILLPRPIGWTVAPLILVLVLGLGTAAFVGRDFLSNGEWRRVHMTRLEMASAVALVAGIALLTVPIAS